MMEVLEVFKGHSMSIKCNNILKDLVIKDVIRNEKARKYHYAVNFTNGYSKKYDRIDKVVLDIIE